MLSFTHHQRAIPLFESFNGDATAISKTAFERIVLDGANEFSILIPNTSKSSLVPIRAFFKEEKQGIYLLAITNRGDKNRAILVTKKPHQTSIEYKNMINEAIRTFPDFNVVYKSSTETKTVYNNELYLEESNASLEHVLSLFFRNKVVIHGIEFPLNEDNQKKYRDEGIMFYPLTERDRSYSKSWKQV